LTFEEETNFPETTVKKNCHSKVREWAKDRRSQKSEKQE
jgi:hypothetical protein